MVVQIVRMINCEISFAFSQTHFIKLLKEVHGSSINYDKVIYKNSHTKIDLVCPLHGSFECLPVHALRGTGCAKCSKRRLLINLKCQSRILFIKLVKFIKIDIPMKKLILKIYVKA